MKSESPTLPWLVFIAMVIATLAVYLPSLSGGYIFDDGVYFLDNEAVHVTTLNFRQWVNAAFSQPAATQFRALSSLSFAANYYFTGVDPFWPKVTNLCIHILNGFFLFLAVRQLINFKSDLVSPIGDEATTSRQTSVLAALVAGTWLILPINLTAVAYVAQRMESLANLFVFLGIYLYLLARRNQFANRGSVAAVWFSVGGCTAIGLCAKESAALLPLYTLCIEFVFTKFKTKAGKFDSQLAFMYFALLLLPLFAGAIWISTWIFKGIAFARDFTITERILTEFRVLLDYVQWILLPNLNVLTFYHDDIPISHGLLDPPSTLLSLISLAFLLFCAVSQRTKRPIFSLGILWFFSGHALTGTIIALELAFEHRNYFPSAGLTIACASLLALEPITFISRKFLPLIASVLMAFYGFTTYLRAEEWSNPLRLAYSEALKRPDSSRAQYELARTLIMAAGNRDNSPLIDRSIEILEKFSLHPSSGIAPLQALIYLNARAQKDIDPAWWTEMTNRLRINAPSQTDIASIVFLYRCQATRECPSQTQELLELFTTALSRSNGNPNLISAYAEFALTELHDPDLSERMSRAAIEANPNSPIFRLNLAKLLIASERYSKARQAIAEIQSVNRIGLLDEQIAEISKNLELAEAKTLSQKKGAQVE